MLGRRERALIRIVVGAGLMRVVVLVLVLWWCGVAASPLRASIFSFFFLLLLSRAARRVCVPAACGKGEDEERKR